MNQIAPIHESAIRSIALDRLFIAPENVRKTPPDATAEAEMKASVMTHGLLENLVVRSDGPDGDYAVVAGGRRLAALKALAADGALDASHPVPCLIVDGNAASGELSLAENVIRIAMHPADQVIAFTKLAESGVTVATIAARFGMSERLVEQRLRLGNAAPELLDAYRTDNIGLETLKAFAVTTDHRRQMAVWAQLANQGYRPAPSQVKRLLTEERIPATSAMARFVSVDAYEAAGGAVLRDLFAAEDEDGIWFEDPALLNNLAMAKLGETVKDLATRWRWATAVPEVDWTEIARYGRIHPEPATPTDEETAELERLRTREDELDNLDEDDWTEALEEEAEAIETRTCEFNLAIEARATYRAEDYAIAGAIATIGRNGELEVIQGLVRPEDMPKPADSGDSATGDPGDGDGDDATGAGRFQRPAISAPTASPADPQAEARKEAGVGIRACRRSPLDPHGIGQGASRERLRGRLRSHAVPARPRRVHPWLQGPCARYRDQGDRRPADDTHERRGLRHLESGRGDARRPLQLAVGLADHRGRRRILRGAPRVAKGRQAHAVRGLGRALGEGPVGLRTPGASPNWKPPSPGSTSTSRARCARPRTCCGRASTRAASSTSPGRPWERHGLRRGPKTRSPRSPRRWKRPSRPAALRSGSPPTLTPPRSPGRRPASRRSTRATPASRMPVRRQQRPPRRRTPWPIQNRRRNRKTPAPPRPRVTRSIPRPAITTGPAKPMARTPRLPAPRRPRRSSTPSRR